jgi:hypothetical protein
MHWHTPPCFLKLALLDKPSIDPPCLSHLHNRRHPPITNAPAAQTRP